MSRSIPIEIKMLTGTANSTRARRKGEPEYELIEDDQIILPPENIKTQSGRDLWHRVCHQLSANGILFESCYEFLVVYCVAHETMNEAMETIKKYGMIIVDKTDTGVTRKQNPAYKIYNESFDQMYRIGLQMGFTPVSKTKINSKSLGDNTKEKNQIKKIGVTG